MVKASLLLPCLAIAPVLAQTTAAPPANAPLMQLEILGPAAWPARFAPTNVGSLLQSEEGQQLWRPWLERFDAAAAGTLGKDGAAVRQLRERLAGYGGLVQISYWMQADDALADSVAATIVFGPDGKTDPDDLAKTLRELLANAMGEAWSAEKVGERDVEVLAEGKQRLTAPRRDGEQVSFVYAASDLPLALGHAVGRPPVAAPKLDAPGIALRVDVAGLLAVTEKDASGDAMTRALLGGVRTASLQLRPAGPSIALELACEFDRGDRGLLGALLPDIGTLPRLAGLIPTGKRFFSVGHWELAKGYESIERAVAAVDASFAGLLNEGEDKPKPSIEERQHQLRATATAELGVDPVAGLLAHLGSERMVYAHQEDPDDRESEFLFALQVRDEKAFEAGLDKVLAKEKSFIQPFERVDHDGVAIARFVVPLLGNLHMSIGRGLWIVATGKDAQQRIAQLLDARKQQQAAGDDAKPPTIAGLPPFADLARLAPEGANGAGATEIVSTLQMLSGIVRGLTAGLGGAAGDFGVEDADPFAELLRKYHLDRARSISGQSAGQWRWRLYW